MNHSASFAVSNPNIFDTPRRQAFSIPLVLIHYICTHPSFTKDGLIKLQQTCKYFFSKNRIVIIDKNVKQKQNGLFLYFRNEFIQIKNTQIQFYLVDGLTIERNDILKSFLKSIYRCCLKSLYMKNLNFPLKKLNFLLKDGQINVISLLDINIYNDQVELVSCHQILERVPKLLYFNYYCKKEVFETENFEKFNCFSFEKKFIDFRMVFYGLSDDIDFKPLCKFIEKNSTKNSFFTFKINMADADFYKAMFQTAINETFQDESVFAKKPYISIF